MVLCIYIYTYIQWQILLSYKKKTARIPFAAIRMDLEIIILSEVSQKEKDKLSYGIIYM